LCNMFPEWCQTFPGRCQMFPERCQMSRSMPRTLRERRCGPNCTPNVP
jgi:hypothetical protein